MSCRGPAGPEPGPITHGVRPQKSESKAAGRPATAALATGGPAAAATGSVAAAASLRLLVR